MKFSQVLLTALFITTSCNDTVKINPQDNTLEKEIKNEIKEEESTNTTNTNTTNTTNTDTTNTTNTDTTNTTNTDTTNTTNTDTTNNEEISDCLKNLSKECVTGKWDLKFIRLNEKGMPPTELSLTESQKNQHIEISSKKVSGRIFILKEDDVSLTDDPIVFNNVDYSLFEDAGEKKIRFQINQTKIESTIKNLNSNVLTLVRSGKTKIKEYDLESIWIRK